MATRIKLNKTEYDSKRADWTQEQAKTALDKLIRRRTVKYHAGIKQVEVDGLFYNYNPSRVPNKTLTQKLFSMKYELDRTGPRKTRRVKRGVDKQAVQRIYERSMAKKIQGFYKDHIKQAVSVRRTKLLHGRDGRIEMKDIKSTGFKGLYKLYLAKDILTQALAENRGLKVWIDVHYKVQDHNGAEGDFWTRSRPYEILNKDEFDEDLSRMIEDIKIQFENKNLQKSGLTLGKIVLLNVHFVKYTPMRGSKYMELPKNILNTKACINIKNDDMFCFKWCIYCIVHEIMYKDHPDRMYHYRKFMTHDDGVNWAGMSFPVTVGDGIRRFEELNPNISVNVYELFKSSVGDNMLVKPLRLTKRTNAYYHCNLLYIEDDDNSHYVVIKDLNKLCFQQYSKTQRRCHLCPYCLHNYSNKKAWENSACAQRLCIANEDNCIYKMPEKGDVVAYDNDSFKKHKTPFAIVLDFEAFNKKLPNLDAGQQTVKHTVHEPNSYCLHVISAFEEFQADFEPVLYRGKDCMDHLFKTLKELEQKFMKYVAMNIPMNLTAEEEEQFQKEQTCHICRGKKGGFCKEYKHKDYLKLKKVRDHCHFTGQFRGAAHAGCNLAYHYRHLKIPVFCHNMKGYDSHFIISKADEFDCKKLSCIAQNSEKFLTFGFDRFEFKDSMAFMATSLEKLVELTKKSNKPLQELFKHTTFGAGKLIKTPEDLDYLTAKGVYPYSYVDSHDRFNETELPAQEAFHNDLANEPITPKAYAFAQEMWQRFKCKTLGDYHDLYLLTDVLLLADVFSVFREMCLQYYGLDCFQFLTLSHFAWNAMLKKTGVKLELLNELDMYHTVESGKRGGMVQASKRYVEANNKYMPDYDPNKESSYITYDDANNLYGLAMSQKLPLNDFMEFWLTEEEILNYDKDDEYGYFVECDLIYPKELHDKHADYPLAPERMQVKADMLSDYSQETYRRVYKMKDQHKVKDESVDKLILNLNDKKHYVTHIRNLQFYLQQGMKLKQVHKVIRFKQSYWLKDWIDFNTDKRKAASCDFEKDLFKLMNNAVFGKTMEDVKNRMNFELIKCPKRFERLVADPTFKCTHQINDNLVGVERAKKEIFLNKPIQVGVAILDLSKLHMYDFYYNVMKPKYQDKVQLCYTDTDSFVFHIKTDDVYKDMYEMKEHFDLSDYDKSHPCFDDTNKKVLGKFKDEFNGQIVSKFCALKAKMYSFKLSEGKEKMTAKGCPKTSVKKQLNFDKYYSTIMDGLVTDIDFKCIRHKNHQLYTMGINKVGLTEYDNKRYYLNSNESRPYGHYKNK